ncbi:MAG: hypothetical protein J3K34DRAFT_393772 [Monoraphidium minutum]|nr:MAG: hypothetical protein J3K34DRAFT_393772 [Monoraphidium minutum]
MGFRSLRDHVWQAGVIVIVLMMLQVAKAAFEVETAGGAVISPASAKRRFDVALANFGVPKYGALLSGQLVYPHADAAYGWQATCTPAECNYGCNFFNESAPPLALKREPGKRYIMLLDRGPPDSTTGLKRPCYFLDKAWHAQAAGADALLVVNDRGGDLSTARAERADCERGLVSQADGDALKALLRKGPVSVALNWTDLVPQAKKVEWEFWTNSNDECGAVCATQRKFIKAFKAAGKQLQVKGLASFRPHYLIWVCSGSTSTKEECETQCIRGGAYCCPDPDDNIHEGYSGADMNVRSLCFERVARERGEPWLWWDFVDRLGDECPMKDKLYTAECAQKVFDAVAGPRVGDAAGRAAWAACADVGAPGATGAVPMLDEELAGQTGGSSGAESTVAILPTVRINGRQYRGNLEAGSVLRALCAGFPAGTEPAVCNEAWVSEDECAEGGDGWRACNTGMNTTLGRTRCINTFRSFACDCGAGYMKVTDKATGQETCAELNECLMSNIPSTREDCRCTRCVCTNTPGGFNCSGPIPDRCTAEHNYGGCWIGTYGGRLYHACSDNLRAFRWAAGRGALFIDLGRLGPQSPLHSSTPQKRARAACPGAALPDLPFTNAAPATPNRPALRPQVHV